MGDSVARAVLAQFAALPKNGKPQAHEHTVLAGIALSLPAAAGSCSSSSSSSQREQQLAVVAVGTGTKCLGASKRLPGGAAVNDCHAEVLCRRALLRWLYREMAEAVQLQQQRFQGGRPGAAGSAAAGTRVLQLVAPTAAGADASRDAFGGWRFQLQPGVALHLYVSQPPCGDASILDGAGGGAPGPGPGQQGGCCQAQEVSPAAASGVGGGMAAVDARRTGAKPLKRQRTDGLAGAQLPDGGGLQGEEPQEEAGLGVAAATAPQWALPAQGEVEPYGAEQARGVVRRKPGRGDATLSMACSDKLARWCLLGLQGSLLSGLLAQPLHFSTVTVSVSGGGGGEVEQPPQQQQQQQPSTPATAAAVALRRALLGRTADLASQRLPPHLCQAAPALHIHRLPPAAPSAADPAPLASVPCPPAVDASARSSARSGGDVGGGGGGDDIFDALGLCPSTARRVPGGSSIAWSAPPSSAFKWKQQQQQLGQQQVARPADAPSTGDCGPPQVPPPDAAAAPHVLGGGTSEVVAAVTGLRVGARRVQPGDVPPAAAQCGVSKAALFAEWQQLATALELLPMLDDAAGEADDAGGQQQQQLQERRERRLGWTYRQAKQESGAAYAAAWQSLLLPPSALEGWIAKPPSLEDFVLQ